MERFFFSQDQDCHWYMIPASKRDRWKEVNNMDMELESTWEAFEEFEQYRTGGGISHIVFRVISSQVAGNRYGQQNL